MVPPYLGAAAASRGRPAAPSTPAVAPASKSRRVNGAPSAGTTVPASETNKAMILLLAAPLLEPCEKCIPGMPALSALCFGESHSPYGGRVRTSRRLGTTQHGAQT